MRCDGAGVDDGADGALVELDAALGAPFDNTVQPGPILSSWESVGLGVMFDELTYWGGRGEAKRKVQRAKRELRGTERRRGLVFFVRIVRLVSRWVDGRWSEFSRVFVGKRDEQTNVRDRRDLRNGR